MPYLFIDTYQVLFEYFYTDTYFMCQFFIFIHIHLLKQNSS